MALIAPSVVPAFNPAVRILQYSAGEITNFQQWYADIAQANSKYLMEWKEEYDMRTTFGMPDLRLTSFVALANEICNPAMIQIFQTPCAPADINKVKRDQFNLFKEVSSRVAGGDPDAVPLVKSC